MSEHPYRGASRGDPDPGDPMTIIAQSALGAAWLLLAEVVLLAGSVVGVVSLMEWMPETWWLVPAVGLPLLWIWAQGGFRRTRRPQGEGPEPTNTPHAPWGSMSLARQVPVALLSVAVVVGHKVGVPWATERVLEHTWMLLPLVLLVVPSGLALRRWYRWRVPRTD